MTRAKRIPLDISVGDVVVYSKYGGTEIKFDGEDYLILSARDVLAVVEVVVPIGVQPLGRPRNPGGRGGLQLTKEKHGQDSGIRLRGAPSTRAGVNILADAVRVTIGPKGPQRRAGQAVGRSDHHQRRGHHRP